MSYEVTATRKRPQTFDELTGQEFVAHTLKSSLSTGRIAHAYLFSGPRGVGKTSAARILAKALNCENGPVETPCGKCANCVEISRGNSLDVIEIDGASNTSVNDVREIKDEVLFAPNSSRYKVYIIDEVHMLSNSAFNALLKTIEEPPPYIVFIFATTELHKVPATIKSRCQQFNFKLIAHEDIKNLLGGICAEMGVKAENDALYWIAKEATGSLRDAYTLFDQVVAFSGQDITLSVIREKLGLIGMDSLGSLVDILSSGLGKESLEFVDEVMSSGVSVEQFLIELSEYYRNLLFLKHGIHRESILGYGPDRFSRKALETCTVTQLEKAVEILLDAYRNIRYSLNQRFELDLLISRIAALPSFFSHKEMMSQIQNLRKLLVNEKGTGFPVRKISDTSVEGKVPDVVMNEQSSGSQAVQSENTAQSVHEDEENSYIEDDEDVSIVDDIQDAVSGDFLKQLVAAIRTKKLALSSALEKATALKLDKDTLYLSFDSTFSENFVRQDLAEVAEKARALLSRPVKVVTEIKGSREKTAGSGDEQVEIVKRVFRGQVIQGESE